MKNILMVIGGSAHPFESCAQIFKEAMEHTGQFAVEVTEDRAALVNPAVYDAIVMYTVGGEMSRDQEQGLVNYVRGGKGVLAIHCANAEMDNFKDYSEMVGTAFIKHGPVADFTVETDDDSGAILPRLSSSFTATDEFYLCERRSEAPLRQFQSAMWHFLKKMWHDTTNDDYLRAYVRFDAGVEAQLVVSNLCAATKPLWTVLGTRRSIRYRVGAVRRKWP